MNCPVCNQAADKHIYHCSECGVYVHEKCWPTHVAKKHKK